MVLGVLLIASSALAQSQSILVMPFFNNSKNSHWDWMGESFAEILAERLAGEGRYIFTRQERLAATDRLGLPGYSSFSHATILKIAEELDADQIIVGHYDSDGTTLTAAAQIFDVKHLRLSSPISESGKIEDLIDIQTNLTWQLLRSLDPTLPLSKRAFAERFPPLRLDAFENYIRGLLAQSQAQQVRLFLEAARRDPLYGPPAFELGRIYLQNKDYQTAIPWLRRVAREDAHYLEANFYLGLCHLGLEDYPKAEAAFSLLAERLPLNEVFNNLGIVESRQGKLKLAAEHLNRAHAGDPFDADYEFNLALNAWRAQDWTGTAKALRAALRLRPEDEQARALLARAAEKSSQPGEAGHETRVGRGASSPEAAIERRLDRLDRVKTNYDETGFRQLQMELANVAEHKAASGSRSRHVEVHLARGQELFAQGKLEEAHKEFTEAILLVPDSHEAHLFLGRIDELTGKTADAIRELRASVWSKDTVDARLLLARLYLQQNRLEDASAQVRAALALDSQNLEAQSLEKMIEARRGVAAVPGEGLDKKK